MNKISICFLPKHLRALIVSVDEVLVCSCINTGAFITSVHEVHNCSLRKGPAVNTWVITAPVWTWSVSVFHGLQIWGVGLMMLIRCWKPTQESYCVQMRAGLMTLIRGWRPWKNIELFAMLKIGNGQRLPCTPGLWSWLHDTNQVLKANTGVWLCKDEVRLDNTSRVLMALFKHRSLIIKGCSQARWH